MDLHDWMHKTVSQKLVPVNDEVLESLEKILREDELGKASRLAVWTPKVIGWLIVLAIADVMFLSGVKSMAFVFMVMAVPIYLYFIHLVRSSSFLSLMDSLMHKRAHRAMPLDLFVVIFYEEVNPDKDVCYEYIDALKDANMPLSTLALDWAKYQQEWKAHNLQGETNVNSHL